MSIKLGFTKEQVIHMAKVFAYIAGSGALAAIILYTTDNPEAFGGTLLTMLINAIAVSGKEFLKNPEE